jgi:hypothetical protein
MKKDIIPVSQELHAKIQACDPDVQDFIGVLQSELRKLHKHNLGLEAKNVSLNSRITVLEEEMEPFRQIREATDEELKEIVSRAIKKKNGPGVR